MMLDSLDTERQISGQNKILYIVENSITLLLSLMLFWFVWFVFLYRIMLFCVQNTRKLHFESTTFS